MQAGMGITDGIIQGKISCFRNKFHKHKEKCSEKRKFLEALCLRSEIFLKNIVFERFIIYISYSISCNSAYNCYIRISNSKDGFQKK